MTRASEVVGGELVIPVGLIVCFVHGECGVIDTLVVPLAVFVEHEHLLGHVVRVDHVQVDALVLLEEKGPRGAPVVVGCDGDHLLHWDVELVHAAHPQDVHVQVASLGVKLHAQHKGLVDEARLDEEGNQREEFGTVLTSHDLIVEATARLSGVIQL